MLYRKIVLTILYFTGLSAVCYITGKRSAERIAYDENITNKEEAEYQECIRKEDLN